mmetsp:Transcript_136863/g.425164  ORF Transcript_136863/g.425164 Transcript_136863/m.425164 type:complete len:302 (+) Transcript_136863:713-1618(+)
MLRSYSLSSVMCVELSDAIRWNSIFLSNSAARWRTFRFISSAGVSWNSGILTPGPCSLVEESWRPNERVRVTEPAGADPCRVRALAPSSRSLQGVAAEAGDLRGEGESLLSARSDSESSVALEEESLLEVLGVPVGVPLRSVLRSESPEETGCANLLTATGVTALAPSRTTRLRLARCPRALEEQSAATAVRATTAESCQLLAASAPSLLGGRTVSGGVGSACLVPTADDETTAVSLLLAFSGGTSRFASLRNSGWMIQWATTAEFTPTTAALPNELACSTRDRPAERKTFRAGPLRMTSM